MAKVQIRTVVIRKWFPPNDPLAAKVARLCILREDFLLEMKGVYTEQIPMLDGSSEAARRTYFIRNIFRTLAEIVGGITRVTQDPEFIALLHQQSPETKEKFSDVQQAFNRGLVELKAQRDAIGGHVQEKVVQETLNDLDPDLFGFMEIAQTAEHSHLKFVLELLMQSMVRGVPPADKLKIFRDTNTAIADMFPAFSLIEEIFYMYAQSRGLLG